MLPALNYSFGSADMATMTTKGVKLQRIGQKDFDTLAGKTELQANAREMARLVLVEGETMGQVGEKFGVSRQRVSLAVEVIRRAHQAGLGMSRSGWVRVDLDLPEALSVLVAEFVEALEQSGASKEAKAVAIAQISKALVAAKAGLVN
jgi:hypothetical protein